MAHEPGNDAGELATSALDDPGEREQYYRSHGLWTDERLGWLFGNGARRWPNGEFVSVGAIRVTYGEFNDWACAAGAELVRRGVQRGDRVLIQLPNRIEALLAQAAAVRIGAVAVPIVPIYRERELRQIVDATRPSALITVQDYRNRCPAAELESAAAAAGLAPPCRLVVDAPRAGWGLFPRRGSRVDESTLPEPLPAEACTMIAFTSGTTSAPKGVMHSSRSILSAGRSFALETEESSDTVFFVCTPLSHVSGFLPGIVWPASLGARTVVLPAWDPGEAAELIDREKATFASGAPVFLHDLIGVYREGCAPRHRVRRFLAGGAAPSARLFSEAQELGMTVSCAYGMTEVVSVAFTAPGTGLPVRSSTAGRVLLGSEVQAVNETRSPLPAGQFGELRIRSPQRMIGYTDASLTAQQMDAAGWFYTGDIGMVDDEGWVTLSGRIKDIINRAGEKFSARDIEEAIEGHPSVDRVAVVGLPDERLGEIVGAFLMLNDARSWTGPETLIEHLRGLKIANQKIPVEWHVMEALPVTASGKLQKHELIRLREANT